MWIGWTLHWKWNNGLNGLVFPFPGRHPPYPHCSVATLGRGHHHHHRRGQRQRPQHHQPVPPGHHDVPAPLFIRPPHKAQVGQHGDLEEDVEDAVLQSVQQSHFGFGSRFAFRHFNLQIEMQIGAQRGGLSFPV